VTSKHALKTFIAEVCIEVMIVNRWWYNEYKVSTGNVQWYITRRQLSSFCRVFISVFVRFVICMCHLNKYTNMRWNYYLGFQVTELGCTAAAAPPPFRRGDPALCGSCPLVTP